MSRAELERALWAVLDTLREYLGDLVLIGGWVPYLHFTYGDVATPSATVSLTAEADLMVPASLPAGGRKAITEILEEAAFDRVGETGVVWGRDVRGGERIEFFLPHRGPALRAGRPIPVAEQPGLKALPLDLLWVLEASTGVIRFPSPDGQGEPVDVRVPSIAAFALNKANTFNLRGGRDGAVKSGKDLVYLRDVMAAGEHVRAIVERDLELLLVGAEADRVGDYVRRAGYYLRNVAERYCPQGVDILVERDGLTPADARADLEGHLADLVVVLAGAADT